MTETAHTYTNPTQRPWAVELTRMFDDFTIPSGDGAWLEYYAVPHALLARAALLLADPVYQPAPNPRALTIALAIGTRLAIALGEQVAYDGRLVIGRNHGEDVTVSAIHSQLPLLQKDPPALAAAEDRAWAIYESLPVSINMVIDDSNQVLIDLRDVHHR
jgi:hypothetical protein